MTECDLLAERQWPCCLPGIGRCGGEIESLGCSPQHQLIPQWLRCREQQESPSVISKIGDATTEALLDLPGQPLRVRQPEPARQLRRGQSAWQLEQRERVSAHLSDDPPPDSFVQLEAHRGAQQRGHRR